MKALQGEQGEVIWQKAPIPECGAGQVRIRVAAAGLNRADLLQRAGLYPPPPGVTSVLGLECSGHIDALGEGVQQFELGEPVCALLAGGGMAEYVVVDARHVLPVPKGLSLLQAAAIPEVYATAWLNLFELARLQPGEKVLLHAGASGVGSAGIQLCKALGNPVWVSVGSADRLAYCEGLGAQGGAIRGDEVSSLDGLKDWGPFDVILDPVGARYADLNSRLVALDGRWVNIGLMGGRRAEIDLALLLGKRVQLIGSTLRTRTDAFKAQLVAQLQARVWPLFEQGALDPQVDETFAVEDANAAFDRLASNRVSGKIVLIVNKEALA